MEIPLNSGERPADQDENEKGIGIGIEKVVQFIGDDFHPAFLCSIEKEVEQDRDDVKKLQQMLRLKQWRDLVKKWREDSSNFNNEQLVVLVVSILMLMLMPWFSNRNKNTINRIWIMSIDVALMVAAPLSLIALHIKPSCPKSARSCALVSLLCLLFALVLLLFSIVFMSSP